MMNLHTCGGLVWAALWLGGAALGRGLEPEPPRAEPTLIRAALPSPLFEERAIPSTIERVTVYPSSALISRRAQVQGPGMYVIQGLPFTLKAQSLRARIDGLQVMSVDVKDRFVRAVPDERLGALQNERKALLHAIEVLKTDLAAANDQTGFYRELLTESLAGQTGSDAKTGSDAAPNLDVWRKGAQFLGQGYSQALEKQRGIEKQLADKRDELRALDAEISRGTGKDGYVAKDVYVSIEGPADKGAALTVEYLIDGASWAPSYDLRADPNLSKVALSYRADVVQKTGEDWNNVELVLSTANPDVGAMVPPLQAIVLYLIEERLRGVSDMRSLGYMENDSEEDKDFKASTSNIFGGLSAAVLKNAGSLRYQVARRETIPSRSDASRVLVGFADLAVEAEHRCVPALDLGVWLRARATNSSQWELLPGLASVYFAGDFVGRTTLEHIRLGEEFMLDLGLDPNVTVERVALDNKSGSAGFFGSKNTLTEKWRLRFKATGAAARRPDGSVLVVVQEVLPKSQNEDLKVELDLAVPPVSKNERYAADRADRGILTWELLVPHMGEATIEWALEMTYPDDMELSR